MSVMGRKQNVEKEQPGYRFHLVEYLFGSSKHKCMAFVLFLKRWDNDRAL